MGDGDRDKRGERRGTEGSEAERVRDEIGDVDCILSSRRWEERRVVTLHTDNKFRNTKENEKRRVINRKVTKVRGGIYSVIS